MLLAWWLVGAAQWLPASLLPPLGSVLQAATESIGSGALPAAAAISGGRLLAGFVLGSGLGIVLGLVSGLSRHGEDLLDSTLQGLRAIPFLALAPFFSLWFSVDEVAKVALVAFGATFPAYLGTVAGIRATDVRLVEAARVCGLSARERVREVILPGAFPELLTGLRIGFSWALAALVSAELTSSSTGIGTLIAEAREYVQTELLFVCVLTYALLGLAADTGLRLVARWQMPWRRVFGGQ
ncbi:ABC transporter permease [Xenophilus sp. Marseille-Q4582]|uniref:ABC transporter permease n=1 Tax=Xenophilus sp. Marseille-Q4582 TaxID=2866600 RepID=UPI001CE417C4|nr:ABC transporter permease [Xenophilus sp. Marseille-Q4582]